MNVDPASRALAVAESVWTDPAMRTALAGRDLAEVFRLLRRVGVSQRAIAAATGLSPSEVYGMLGDGAQVTRSLHRAADELGRGDPATAAPWVRFFAGADLDAMTGMTYLELTGRDPSAIPAAREALARAVAARGPDMSRSRAFELSALSLVLLRGGEQDQGIQVGWQAVELAEQVRSVRVRDRLRPLADQADRTTTDDARDLTHHVRRLCGT